MRTVTLPRGCKRVHGVHFAPDGRLLAVAGPDARVVRAAVWADTGAVVPLAGRNRAADVLAASDDLGEALGFVGWSADGQRIAVAAGREFGQRVREFDAACQPLAEYRPPGTGTAQLAAYSPCGRWLVAAAGRRAFRFPVGGGGPAVELKTHAGKLHGLAFAPDGRLLTAGRDGVVCVWDVDAGRLLDRFAPGVGPLTAVAVSGDGLTAAAGGVATVVEWDL